MVVVIEIGVRVFFFLIFHISPFWRVLEAGVNQLIGEPFSFNGTLTKNSCGGKVGRDKMERKERVKVVH